MRDYPKSKMRKRWAFNRYKPYEIVFDVVKRASKYKAITWPECKPFLLRLCEKYSMRPEATLGSIVEPYISSEFLVISNGVVINDIEAMKNKEKRIWQNKIDSGLDFFHHHGEFYCRCSYCGKYEKEAFGHECVKCSKKGMELYKMEVEIKEVKSLINRVKKICQSQSKQQAT